jgi:hypothetical protein
MVCNYVCTDVGLLARLLIEFCSSLWFCGAVHLHQLVCGSNSWRIISAGLNIMESSLISSLFGTSSLLVPFGLRMD